MKRFFSHLPAFVETLDWSQPDPAIDPPEHRRVYHELHYAALFALEAAAAIENLARDTPIDIIEAPESEAPAWFLLDRARESHGLVLGRIPVVTVLHSPYPWMLELNRAAMRWDADHHRARMEMEQARWSHGLICPSAAVADWTRSLWSPDRPIEVVPLPLGDLEPLARASAQRRQSPRQPATPRRMLFAGRLEHRKAIPILLEAFDRAIARGAELELHLAGGDTPDPDDPTRLVGASRLAALSETARARVHVHGNLSPAALADLRATCPIAAVPSPMDNFPVSCMEAMASGQFVIASRAGGMAEMIDHPRTGLLVAPADTHAWSDALCHAARLPAHALDDVGRAAANAILQSCGNDVVLAARLDH
ncbi:glycosyltransferase family 4 protein [Leptolyngbya sp. 15MV]|nr:glycosyltransferase family 4 protein [Leptolyngbya sp. 15MV]